MKKILLVLCIILIVFNVNAQGWGRGDVWEDTPVKEIAAVDTVKAQVVDTAMVLTKSAVVIDSLTALDHVNILAKEFVIELSFDRPKKTLYILQHARPAPVVRVIPEGIEEPFFGEGFVTQLFGTYVPSKKEIKHEKLVVGEYRIEVTTSANKLELWLSAGDESPHLYNKTWSFK